MVVKSHKEHITQDIEDGKIINAIKIDKRRNEHWRNKYFALLKHNQSMRVKLDKYEDILKIEKEIL